jgi:hypothetical protein
MWIMTVQLYKRFVRVFQAWPWRLGQLLDGEVDLQTRQEIAREFFTNEACCLEPFSAWLRGQVASTAEVLADGFKNFLRGIFASAPASNVRSENRFARQARHNSNSQGNAADLPTLAANHVLAECKTNLDAHQWFL